IFLRDLARNVETLVVKVPENAAPVWSPDGSRFVFTRNGDLYMRESAVDGREELLLQSAKVKRASDWSRDGRYLLYTEDDVKSQADIWYLPDPLKPGEKTPQKFLATSNIESQGQFSPDGKWIAYVSDESGLNEVYVRPFPPRPGQWTVSTAGGTEPRWASNGEI